MQITDSQIEYILNEAYPLSDIGENSETNRHLLGKMLEYSYEILPLSYIYHLLDYPSTALEDKVYRNRIHTRMHEMRKIGKETGLFTIYCTSNKGYGVIIY